MGPSVLNSLTDISPWLILLDVSFIGLFPMVYYAVGNLEQPRSLLRACVRGAKVSHSQEKLRQYAICSAFLDLIYLLCERSIYNEQQPRKLSGVDVLFSCFPT